MLTDCVIVADCCLFFGCKTAFSQYVKLDLWNFTALPLIQNIVFLCCSWSFSTFNHSSSPFMYSSFFLKVWISLSIICKWTFALTWAPSFPYLHIFIYWCSLPTPLRVNIITECPLCDLKKEVSDKVDFLDADKH